VIVEDASLKAEAIEKRRLPYTTVQLDRCPTSSRQESQSVLEGRDGRKEIAAAPVEGSTTRPRVSLLVSICIELLQLDLRRRIEGMTRSSPIPRVLEGFSRRTVTAKRIVATG
jgi:hypothetical protein